VGAPSAKKQCKDNKYKQHIRRLKEEMKKKKPKSKVIRELLAETEDMRRQWIQEDAPPSHDVVLEFPVFRHQKWVC
jgi:hypothetical protein